MPTRKRPTKKHSKIASFGTKIMAEAKRIRRAHPGKKWTSCVSAAAKSLKH